MSKIKILAALLLLANLVVLFDLTLVQWQRSQGSVNLVPFRTIRGDLSRGGAPMVINFLGNLAVTAPLGALAPVVWRGMRRVERVAGLGFAVSLVIESLQYRSGHRVADVDDLILNTLGAMLGYLAWLSIGALLRTIRERTGLRRWSRMVEPSIPRKNFP